MKSVRHPIGHVSVLVAAVLSSLTAISHANTSFENTPIPQSETNYQNTVFDSQNISLGGGNRLNTPRQRPTPNGITIRAEPDGITVTGDVNQTVMKDDRTVTVRPGESPEDALISEIGLEYRSTKPSPELYVEVLNNKDLTLSTNGGSMGFANESAIVFDGGGTLNFFRNGTGNQTLNIFQGSESSYGEDAVIVNQEHQDMSASNLAVNGNLNVVLYAGSLYEDSAAIRFYPYIGQPDRQFFHVTGNLNGNLNYRSSGDIDSAFLFPERAEVSVDGNVDVRMSASVSFGVFYGVRNRGFNSEHVASDIRLGREGKEVALHDFMLVANSPEQGEGAEVYGLYTSGPASEETGAPEIVVRGDARLTDIRAAAKSVDPTVYAYASGAEAHDDGVIRFLRGLTVNNIAASVNEAGAPCLSGTTDASSEAYALSAVNGGTILVNHDRLENAHVKIENNLLSYGRHDASNRLSLVDINFVTPESFFTGLTLSSTSGATDSPGTTNLRFFNGATWNVPDDNRLEGELHLNNGNVILGHVPSSIESDIPFAVNLEVKNLTGEAGLFSMRVDKSREITDHLTADTGTGSHKVRLRSTGDEPTEASLMSLIDTLQGDATFALETGPAEFGLYRYDFVSTSEGDKTTWYLDRTQSPDPDPGPNPPGPGPDPGPNPPGPDYSNSARAVLALTSLASQGMQYVSSLSDLRKRLGEVRRDENDGLWVRAVAAKDRMTGFEGMRFKQTSYRFNVGFDHASGPWLFGGDFAYAENRQKMEQEVFKGNSHAYGLDLYATYRADNGGYADFVVSGRRNHQHLTTVMLDGVGVKGSYRNTGYGASIEVGRLMTVSEKHDVFFEPQAQLAYFAVQGKDFVLSNGLTVRQKDYESLTGRIGGVLGKNFTSQETGRFGEVALHAGWKGNLFARNGVTVNDVPFSDRFLHNRFYYGVSGYVTHGENLAFYAYAEREKGQGYAKAFEAGIGMKYRF